MSFTFYSAGNKEMEVAPFRVSDRLDNTPVSAYERKRNRVMEYLVSFSNRARLGMDFDPVKDSFPDSVDMAVIRTTDPERWAQLQVDAASDLALNGFPAPVTSTELALVEPSEDHVAVPVPRQAVEEIATADQQAA